MRRYEKTFIGSGNFVKTLKANVDNEKLTDAEFREFVRNTLPIVNDGTKEEPKS